MKALKQLKDEFLLALSEPYGEREAKNLFMEALFRIDGYGHRELILNQQTRREDVYIQTLSRMAKKEPVQYIFGRANFMDMELEVSPEVLIPRPETEELVHWIIEDVDDPSLRILDIGTGSGCIAISLAKYLPNSMVFACDLSPGALNIAMRNAEKQKVKVRFNQLNALNDKWPEVDVVVSNPPYIPFEERKDMDPLVTQHEPAMALFVEGDPLVFYRKIAEWVKESVKLAYMEIHEDKKNELKEMIQDLGLECEFKKDLQGKYRMLKIWKDGHI